MKERSLSDTILHVVLVVSSILAALAAFTIAATIHEFEPVPEEPVYNVLAVPAETPGVTCFMLLRKDNTVSQMSCVQVNGENDDGDTRPQATRGIYHLPTVSW